LNNSVEKKEGSDVMILVKNLPYRETMCEELLKLFSSMGEELERISLPPSKAIVVMEYRHGNGVKRAFQKLVYT